MFLILFSVSVSAACEFDENFDYVDDIRNHGWYGFSTPRSPVDNTLLWQSGYGTASRAALTNQTTGIFNITFQYRLNNPEDAFQDVQLYYDGIVNHFDLRFSNNSAWCVGGVAPCIYSHDAGGAILNISDSFEWYDITITVDLDKENVSIYNGTNTSGTLLANFTLTIGSINQLTFNPFAGSMYYDNITCVGVAASSPAQECTTPNAFCDDFDYTTPLFETNGWKVITGGQSVNATFAPISNQLNLQQTGVFYAPSHELIPFDVDYRTASDVRVIQSVFSPVFTSELNILITDGGLRYSARDQNDKYVYILKAVLESNGSVSWSYATTTTAPLTYTSLCKNCSTNVTQTLRAISYFANDNCGFPFNSTQVDNIKVFIGNTQLGGDIPHLDNTSCSANKYEIIKDADNEFIIDNYFVMVGTDKSISNYLNFQSPLFDNATVDTSIFDEGEEDMMPQIENLWVTFGLKSQASRTVLSLFLMFLLACGLLGLVIGTGTQISTGIIGTITLIEFIFMLLLVFIKLLPVWVVIVFTIISAGIGSYAAILHARSGG